MDHFELVKARKLYLNSKGNPSIKIGIIDGPVFIDHPLLEKSNITIDENISVYCNSASSMACIHGTFIIGMLKASRKSLATAICPNCSIFIRPIFSDANGTMPVATPEDLAYAIYDCIEQNVNIINLSIDIKEENRSYNKNLSDAIQYAIKRNIILVTSSGNDSEIKSTILTSNPWIITVVPCNNLGFPLEMSNLSHNIGRYGVMAPGENITSLSPDGKYLSLSGSSVAVPFVAGFIALLLSLYPDTPSNILRFALTNLGYKKKSVIPQLINIEKTINNLERSRQ